MSKKNTTTLTDGLSALYELTRQRIRDGVRSPATLEMQEAHGRWLCTELGGRAQLKSLDEERLDFLVAPRVPPRRFGAETLRKRMTTLRGVLAVAHRRRWIPRMPAFPQVLAPWRPRQRFLEKYSDAVRIFEALPPHRASWFWVCLWTGQHASDVDRMTWADVGLGTPGWFLRRNSKTRKTPLRVRMPKPLARHLRARFRAERPAVTARIVQPWPSRKSTLPLRCYRLGLPPVNAIDLRHTLFTWAIRRLGITPGIVAWAGHSSPAMMARAYAHALPAGLQEVADELDAFAEGEPDARTAPPLSDPASGRGSGTRRPPQRSQRAPIASGEVVAGRRAA